MLKAANSRPKILLVDDSVTMHRAVALSLKKENFELITCDNGQDGLRLALEHSPSIVLADLDMPGLTGIELCAAIREQPVLRETKVILLCGSFDQVDEGKLEKIQADGRLWKPFESHVLVTLLHTLLKQPVRESSDPTSNVVRERTGIRESSSPTLPPVRVASPSSSDTAPLAGGDVVRDMTLETFRSMDATLPPTAPSNAGDNEKTLPPISNDASVDEGTAIENLWAENFTAATPPVVDEDETSTFEIVRSDIENLIANESDLSQFRQSAAPTAAPTAPPAPVTPPPAARTPTAATARPAAQGWNEDQLRALVRDEVERAFNGKLREKIQAQLAQVVAEIDQA